MARPSRFSPEVRERAVRMVFGRSTRNHGGLVTGPRIALSSLPET